MKNNKAERLGTIVTVRENQKKQTTRELLKIVHQKAQEETHLQKLTNEKKSAVASSFETSRVRAHNAQTNSAFIKRLEGDIQLQHKTIKKIERIENSKREELVERVKAKNIIEKLQEKVKEEIRKEADNKEQKLLDTISQRMAVGRT
jgi:flagellar export protein FliJ